MIALFFTWLYACHLTATLLRLVCLRYSILVSFSVIFLVVPDEGPEWTESASTLFSPIKFFYQNELAFVVCTEEVLFVIKTVLTLSKRGNQKKTFTFFKKTFI